MKLIFTRVNGPVVEVCVKLESGEFLTRNLSPDSAISFATAMIQSAQEARRFKKP